MSQPASASSGLAALLSLSQAAASAQPIPIPAKHDPAQSSKGGNASGNHPPMKHRRLSSTGQTKRRLSDARDAMTRPSPASLHSAASAFASLSITTAISSSSPSVPNAALTFTPMQTSPSAIPIPIASSHYHQSSRRGLAQSAPAETDAAVEVDVDGDDDESRVDERVPVGKIAKSGKGSGKKRGTIFRCESCSKVYRHPSCLVKHRWEHSPHWREASKFLLSKHQQVQLLEAAAILSHLAPGTSLPEDRSLWPSYLSGGLLPPPSASTSPTTANGMTSASERINGSETPVKSFAVHPTSSSVPATMSPLMTRARSGSVATSVSSSGPRLHDYRLPGGSSAGITQFRPGLLGHPTGPGTPAPVVMTPYGNDQPMVNDGENDADDDMRVVTATSPMEVPHAHSHSHSYTASSSLPHSVGTGGWSLPRSSIRSSSVSLSESRSRSGSRSDEEEDSSDEIDADGEYGVSGRGAARYGYGFSSRARNRGAWKGEDDELSVGFSVKEEDEDRAGKKDEPEEEWDGMDMDMEL